MRADHLTYRRATSISLVGLAIQAALAVVFGLYALFARDHAGMTAALYVALGTPVWLGLALVFHQHTLERLEAIEAEALSASTAGTSVFESAGDELQVAARRLAWMHRLLLPAMSLLIGAALIGGGVWRFLSGREFLDPDRALPDRLLGWAIAAGLAAAVAGFVFARFVAGMAKQSAWANLRAGAAAAVGAAIAGLALAIAHFVHYLGGDLPLRYLHAALPVFMVVLGAEVFFNFLLNVYRPRRAGETPRPAFDSRILGFIAAPDRLAQSIGEAISYQFGFDVTTSWFYRLLSRTLALLALTAGALLWALSTLAVVRPDQKGLILRFGRLEREAESGLHLKWPWPIERLETYPALRVNEIDLATPKPTREGPVLWTTPHVDPGDEVFVLLQTAAADAGGARDLGVVAVEVPVHFTVRSLEKYERLAPREQRADLLRAVAQREMIETLAAYSVDELLGAARSRISDDLRVRIAARFEAMDAGVDVLFAGVTGVHPPQDEEVAASFERVTAADQRREAAIERARAQALRERTLVAGDAGLSERIVARINELERATDAGADAGAVQALEEEIQNLLAQAGGEAESAIVQARAERWEKHMNEWARALRYAGQSVAFRAAPAVFRAEERLRAIADMARNARVFVTAFEEPRVRWNLEDVLEVGGVPAPVTPKED